MELTKRFLFFVFLCGIVLLPHAIRTQPNNNSGNKQQSESVSDSASAPPTAAKVLPAVDQRETEDACKARQEEREVSKQTWEKFGIVLNSLLFIAVLVGTWLTYRQVQLTQATVNHTFDAERAYVGIKHIELTSLEPNTHPSASIILVNGGRTPAFDVFFTGGFALVKWDAPTKDMPASSLKESIGDKAGSFLSSGMERHADFKDNAILKPQMLADIMSGRGKLLFFSTVYYRDVRKIRREISFRYYIDATAGLIFKELID